MTVSASRRLVGLAVMDPPTALESSRAAGLTPDWLDTEYAREAWRCIAAMDVAGSPIDEHFVAEYAASNRLTVPAEYLAECRAVAPSRRNGVDSLVDTLRKEYVERGVRDISERLALPHEDPSTVAVSAANDLMKLVAVKQTRDKDTIRAEIELKWENARNGIMSGVPCPLARLYEWSGGAPAGMVTVLVAHGGTGKSALSLQWADFASNHGWPCVYFPFEDLDTGAYERLAGMRADVSTFKLAMGKGVDDDWERAKAGLHDALKSPIIIDSERGTVGDLAVRVQQYVAKRGAKAVFVDALKDIECGRDGVERDIEIMTGLDKIAKRHRIAVIATHHVRKAPTQSTEWQAWNITRADLKGSGQIWDTARQVIALQMWPSKDSRRQTQGESIKEFDYAIDVLKNNHGVANVRIPVRRTHTLEWLEKSDLEIEMDKKNKQ